MKHKTYWPVRLQCHVLNVSHSGYVAYHHRQAQSLPKTPQRLSDAALLVNIHAVYSQARGEYGWPRIWRQLKINGVKAGKTRVQTLMQANGIQARGKRKYVVTTDSKHSLPIAPNLLNRQFKVATPNQVWAGDMTYIRTEEGWLYLAAVMDLHSRAIVGWSMQPHMEASLVDDALKMAWFRRKPAQGLIFHSDRGSQYCSHAFQKTLKDYKMKSSMSRKANCWDNAPTESLWGSLKVGRLYGRKFATRREAMDEIIDWMLFYNHSRLHSTLGYISPMRFEQNWLAAQLKNAA